MIHAKEITQQMFPTLNVDGIVSKVWEELQNGDLLSISFVQVDKHKVILSFAPFRNVRVEYASFVDAKKRRNLTEASHKALHRAPLPRIKD